MGWWFPGGAGGKGGDRDHGRKGGCHREVWGVPGPAPPHLTGPLGSWVCGKPGSSWDALAGSRVWAPRGGSPFP